jgi:triosephosphate isomerase
MESRKKAELAKQPVSEQLEGCLKNISPAKIANVSVCYEPVWAISSNNPDHLPTTDEIMSAKLLIKKFLVGKYGMKIGGKIKIIYGGSVDSNSVKETCIDSGMDGALIGKESLKSVEFCQDCRNN